MASEKVAVAWGLFIILVLLFPTFNDEVNAVAVHVNATILESGLPSFLPLTYVVMTIGYFGFILFYTAEEIR